MNPEKDQADLCSLDPMIRRRALELLSGRIGSKPSPGPLHAVNLHVHTTCSFSARNYTPSAFAWEAARQGLRVAGIVDSDGIGGLEEFHQAGRLLNLRTTVGMETRVRVPDLEGRVIHFPHEPGVASHMGIGLPYRRIGRPQEDFLFRVRDRSIQQGRALVQSLNLFLAPLEVDPDNGVLPSHPNGAVTARHVCATFAHQSYQQFPDAHQRNAFWTDKLSRPPPSDISLLGEAILCQLVQTNRIQHTWPSPALYPTVQEMNRFILGAGGIPTLVWHDGRSEVERRVEPLLDLAMKDGALAVNIILANHYTAGRRDTHLAHLQQMMEAAERRGMPIVIGTEMETPDQPLYNDLTSTELAPFAPLFLRGAYIVYAHTILQRANAIGYASAWARRHFPDLPLRNTFYEEIGRLLDPAHIDPLNDLPHNMNPVEIRSLCRQWKEQ